MTRSWSDSSRCVVLSGEPGRRECPPTPTPSCAAGRRLRGRPGHPRRRRRGAAGRPRRPSRRHQAPNRDELMRAAREGTTPSRQLSCSEPNGGGPGRGRIQRLRRGMLGRHAGRGEAGLARHAQTERLAGSNPTGGGGTAGRRGPWPPGSLVDQDGRGPSDSRTRSPCPRPAVAARLAGTSTATDCRASPARATRRPRPPVGTSPERRGEPCACARRPVCSQTAVAAALSKSSIVLR